jgi:hypothetical protein
MLSNSFRASLGESTGVLPFFTMCFGPRRVHRDHLAHHQLVEARRLAFVGRWLVAAATGGADGVEDLLIANEALSQLSYGPAKMQPRCGGGVAAGGSSKHHYISLLAALSVTQQTVCHK